MSLSTEPNWTLEGLKIAQGFFGTLVGGGLVLLAGWLADRRKTRAENETRDMREKALLTGMFAVRQHIAERLNDFAETSDLARLEPLRTAQSYVHRMIDKAPGESEALMIAIVAIGLALDTVIATLDRRPSNPDETVWKDYVAMLVRDLESLDAGLEQFDVITHTELTILSEDEMSQFPGYPGPVEENEPGTPAASEDPKEPKA